MVSDSVRLTMAQALVRYLCNQFTEIDGERVPLFAGLFAIFGHGNVTCLSEALEVGSGHAPDLARTERTVDGAGRDRLRQGEAPASDHDRGDLHRAGGAQHGDRRRRRPCQPPAGAAAIRRHLRQSSARPGAAASRTLRRSDDHDQRRLQGGDALLGPHRSSRADHLLPAAGGGRRCWIPRLRSGLHRSVRRTLRKWPSTIRDAFFEPTVWSIPRPRPDRRKLCRSRRRCSRRPRSP